MGRVRARVIQLAVAGLPVKTICKAVSRSHPTVYEILHDPATQAEIAALASEAAAAVLRVGQSKYLAQLLQAQTEAAVDIGQVGWAPRANTEPVRMRRPMTAETRAKIGAANRAAAAARKRAARVEVSGTGGRLQHLTRL